MDLTMAEKCENLMNIVVESRKRFGKMCVDYERKTTLMENKILNLTTENFSNHKIKSKNPLPSIDVEDMKKDIDGFEAEILERTSRINKLKKKIKDTHNIVHQLQQDDIAKKVLQPLTADTMLAQAKAKLDHKKESYL